VKQQEASERAKCRSYALAKVIAAGWFPANALTFKPAAETSVCMGNENRKGESNLTRGLQEENATDTQ